MAKRLKLKLSRVIPSLQFCRTKQPSRFVETPVPAIYRISPFNPKAVDITYPNLPAPPPSTPEYSFIEHSLSPKIVAIGCGGRSGSCIQDVSSDCSFKSPDYTGKKEAAAPPRHVGSKQDERKAYSHRKIYHASTDGGISPVWVNENKKNKQRDKKDRNVEESFSSRDSGIFSSEEDEHKEIEARISSSRIFSNEYSSSEFNGSMDFYTSETTKRITNKKVNTNIKKIPRLRRYASKNHKGSNMTGVQSPLIESPVRESVLKRMMACIVEGKVKESVAVIKKSVDPYEDFKRSMLEMILEKEMFEVNDLQQLLQCFMSLNARQYHGIIVEAFTEIWEVMFCDGPASAG